jgi:hypothetical protein
MPEPVVTRFHLIADALTSRLRQAFPAPTFDVQLMPAVPSRAEWDRLTHTRPFVGLAWAGFEPRGQVRSLSGAAKWIVYLVCDNVGSSEALFRGDSRGIGLFGMVQAAAAMVHGATIDGVGSTTVTQIESLYREDWAAEDAAIAAIGIDVGATLSAAPAGGADLDDFLRLTCAWVIPAPDGSAPMPTDTLTLRG